MYDVSDWWIILVIYTVQVRAMEEENIYCKVPSELLHPLRATLPPIEEASKTPYERTVEIPIFGRVVVTFKRFDHRHHKSGHSFWVVERVVRAKG